MTCLACHAANEDDARFCEQCGQPFETVCPTCHCQVKAGSRFCRLCGQSLSPPLSAPHGPQGKPRHQSVRSCWTTSSNIAVKGSATKMRVYRVTHERSGWARIDVARERGFTRLVGRERELELLRHCFDLAKDGRGQAISLIGDAGLGKSRLLYECRQLFAGTNLTWLDGRCGPYGTALAYLPLIDVLKQHFRIDASDSDTDIRDKVHRRLEAFNLDVDSTAPYLLHVLATEGSMLPGMSTEAIKYRIFEALQALVIETANQQPLVIAIEDWDSPPPAIETRGGRKAARLCHGDVAARRASQPRGMGLSCAPISHDPIVRVGGCPGGGGGYRRPCPSGRKAAGADIFLYWRGPSYHTSSI